MQIPTLDQYRLKDKVRLTLRVNYISSVLSIIFGIVCTYFLNITQIIPSVFIVFGVLNLTNTIAFHKHKLLGLTYNITSIMALACSVIITIYSGGINSPFIFVLALVVFAGYISTKEYGRIYLNLNLLIIILIYSQSIAEFKFTENVVPVESKNIFALFSILFSVYLLGGVIGKNLLKAHNELHKIRNENEARIREKDTLLKEIHHRVKNNLQTVSSLLSLQSRSIEEPRIKTLIKSSQNRVISMAMVHEMLYMRHDLSKIEYKSYVEELSDYLIRSFKGTENNITLNIIIPDIKLGIDTAIPLGLLINEVITNALKYGIKDDDQGEIHIELVKSNGKDYILYIGDDGEGFPEGISHKNTKSLGLKLIHNLSRQLKGSINRDSSKKGTNYIVKFSDIQHPFKT
ncbi:MULTISPECIES: sensor histidine kinase [Arenibacter]|uniref:sensor histidine kinase n=1 Tax=Arenibacter TaxID=178469 RepID=UPI0004DED14D|nr:MULTISPECIES: sensor histidine kinase [Arenibacter]GBF19617.1 putative sensor histidine kinase pdtaS [Arenibacter sp. NBRC 103722]|tara:strand:+ start:68767 stop:69975 length:1209 start_codon:yes stop_codon:yes gene_type:complete